MDSGYWFLVSIWSICMVHGIENYLGTKFTDKEIFMNIVFSGILYIILLLLALIIGLSFLGLKYTLYYFPFYYLGYIYHKSLKKYLNSKLVKRILVSVAALIFVLITLNFNAFTAEDNLINIGLRILSSVTGCIITFALISIIILQFEHQKIIFILSSIGRKTLGMYLLHSLFYSVVITPIGTSFYTIEGIGYVAINFIIATVASYGITCLLECNRYSSLLFLGKRNHLCR